MLTSPLAMSLRSLTRRLGLNKFLGGLLAGSRYEDRFGPAFRAAIKPGDTVWDIGANVGVYTSVFVAASGPEGRVVAFEPTPDCFQQLQKAFAGRSEIVLKNMAVGDSDGEITMLVEADALAATHRIVTCKTAGGLSVPVRSAASLVRDEPGLFPHSVKIDVEGHEGAVMDGFLPLLSDPRLHAVGIEVHFGLLDQRGESHRPKELEDTLARHGFSVRWTDPSHLLATR